ncbi:type II secretion system protein [bacterium]|nr:type II secretion system protein [bacterium]MBT4649428.1 type II secretion system protein [bacterium]
MKFLKYKNQAGFTQHHFKKFKSGAGFSLIELIVAIAIFAILASGVLYVVTSSYTNFYGVGDKQSIAEFAQEGLEAVRSIRENSWQYMEDNVGSNLGIAKDANEIWEFSGSENTLGDLTRVITLSVVSRDTDGNITEGAGAEDPLTKKVTVTVSGSGISDYVLNSYLTSWSNRVWEQTDWSGGVGTEFWSYENKAYTTSSVDGTSVIGDLTLAYIPGSLAWLWPDDVADIASTTLAVYSFSALIDDDNDQFYLGAYSSNAYRYDITDIRTNGFGSQSSLAVGFYQYGSGLNSVYPHYYVGGTEGQIKTVSTSTFAVLQSYSTTKGAGTIYGFAIQDDGTHMYAVGSLGSVWSLAIAADGTLTCQNCKSGIPQSMAKTSNVNAVWLDDSEDALYIVSDDSTYALSRIDVSSKTALTTDYSYANSYDMTDIKYIGTNGDGDNRFIIISDTGADEFQIIDDDISESEFVKVAGADLSAESTGTIYPKDVAYTGNDEAIVMAYVSVIAPRITMFTISGVTTGASPSLSIDLADHETYGTYSIYYHPMAYSAKQYGAILGGITFDDSATRFSAFVDQEEIASPGVYAASGSLVSSKLDIGSTDQELHSVTISQDIPSGCDIDITLEADDDINFGSATSQAFSSTTSVFTEEVNTDMQGERWLRYTVDMDACDSNADTPTLYSFKLNYR